MKTRLLHTPLHVLCACLILASFGFEALAKTKHYADAAHGFELDYPKLWVTTEIKREGYIFGLLPGGTVQDPTIAVAIPPFEMHKKGKAPDIDAMQRGFLDGVRKHIPDAEIKESKDLELGGEVGFQCIITGHVGDTKAEMKSIATVCVHDDKVYMVAISGTPARVDMFTTEFDALVQSFHFLKVEKKK